MMQNSSENSTSSWAIVTPSYNLDFERCKLLCRSVDAYVIGSWHHYIIVDPIDLKLFEHLKGPRRSIINKADILPQKMLFVGKVPFMRLGRVWFSWRHGPVFGWQMQQFVKMLMAHHLKEHAMAFCDSDIFFLRPFNFAQFERGKKVKFSSQEATAQVHHKLISNSIELLGLDTKNITRLAASDPFVVWHRPTVLAMLDYLTALHKKPWHEAIGSKLMFGEFQLYSLFVDYIQKTNPNIYRDETCYCKTLWTKEQALNSSVEAFCKDLSKNEVAVCVQSLIGADIKNLERQFENSLVGNIASA